MRDAFRKVRRFLMSAHSLSEDEAISLISAGVDLGISQVANGNWGVHAIVRKAMFIENEDTGDRPASWRLPRHFAESHPALSLIRTRGPVHDPDHGLRSEIEHQSL